MSEEKKQTKKETNAFEYLMAYGWVLVVIVCVVAGLFAFGVFEPKETENENVEELIEAIDTNTVFDLFETESEVEPKVFPLNKFIHYKEDFYIKLSEARTKVTVFEADVLANYNEIGSITCRTNGSWFSWSYSFAGDELLSEEKQEIADKYLVCDLDKISKTTKIFSQEEIEREINCIADYFCNQLEDFNAGSGFFRDPDSMIFGFSDFSYNSYYTSDLIEGKTISAAFYCGTKRIKFYDSKAVYETLYENGIKIKKFVEYEKEGIEVIDWNSNAEYTVEFEVREKVCEEYKK